jgi:hypothetical protein
MSTRGCICSRTARRWGPEGACLTCGQRVLESQLTPVLLAILTGGTGLVLFRNTTGYDATRRIRYGLAPGSADYVGAWLPTGRLVAVELKTATGRQSEEQVAWQALITASGRPGWLGGIYALVRCEADARALLTRLRGAAGSLTTQDT